MAWPFCPTHGRQIKLMLYRALVRSKLDYGCVVYGCSRKSYMAKLAPVQNQGLRICLNAFRTTHAVVCLAVATLTPVRADAYGYVFVRPAHLSLSPKLVAIIPLRVICQTGVTILGILGRHA